MAHCPMLTVVCKWNRQLSSLGKGVALLRLLTPAGRNVSQIISPPSCTTRGCAPGAGGNSLSVSSRTANIYLSFCTLSSVISCSEEKADRTSSVSLDRTSGLAPRRYVAPESAVAVVSEPAIMRVEALVAICWGVNFLVVFSRQQGHSSREIERTRTALTPSPSAFLASIERIKSGRSSCSAILFAIFAWVSL